MSGWDEGNVYYTDQGTAGERDDGEGITPGQARRKFADFFRNFRGEPTAEFPDGRLVYRDKLDQDQPPQELVVLMDDIIGKERGGEEGTVTGTGTDPGRIIGRRTTPETGSGG